MKTYWNYSHIYHLVQFKKNNNKSVHWYERFRTILGDLLFTSCVSQSRQDLINLVYAILSYFLSIIYFTQPVSGVKKQQKKRNFGYLNLNAWNVFFIIIFLSPNELLYYQSFA